MSRVRHEPYPTNLFQQLAVLVGMMGALIIPLLGLTKLAQKSRDAGRQETAPVSEQEPYKPQILPPLPELVTFEELPPLPPVVTEPVVPKELPPLVKLVDPRTAAREERDQTAAALAQLQETAPKPGDERNRLDLLMDHLTRLKTELNQVVEDRRKLEEENRRAEKELDQLRKLKIDKEHQSKHVENRYAIVPYSGPQGTARRPIYLECRRTGITLQPEGVTLDVELFQNGSAGNNPLAVLVRALVNELKTEGPDGVPYPLLIVRPEGITGYYVAQRALAQVGVPVGYELVDDDVELAFNDPDPKQQAVAEAVVAALRQQRTAPMEAASLLSGGGSYPSRGNNPFAQGRPPSGKPGVGALLAQGGPSGGYSSGTGGLYGAAPGTSAGASPDSAAGSGTSATGPSAGSLNGQGGLGLADAGGAGDGRGADEQSGLPSGGRGGPGRPDSSPGAVQGEGSASGDVSQPQGTSEGLSQQFSGTSQGSAETANASRPRLGTPAGEMDAEGGNDTGTWSQGRSGGPPMPTPVQIARTGPGSLENIEAGMGEAGDSASTSLLEEEEPEGLLQPRAASFANVTDRQASSATAQTQRAKPLTFDELVLSRQPQQREVETVPMDDPPNFGPPERDSRSSGVTGLRIAQRAMRRAVTVECRADGLILLPGKRFIPLDGDSNLSTVMRETYRHILKEVSQWEAPGPYYRWQPILHIRVQPDALESYYSLRLALVGSRIEVVREWIEDESTWGLNRKSLREVWQ